jgi:hypothetical protein
MTLRHRFNAKRNVSAVYQVAEKPSRRLLKKAQRRGARSEKDESGNLKTEISFQFSYFIVSRAYGCFSAACLVLS